MEDPLCTPNADFYAGVPQRGIFITKERQDNVFRSPRTLQPAAAGSRFAPLHASSLVVSNALLIPFPLLLNWYRSAGHSII
jgi:hypothetical protein